MAPAQGPGSGESRSKETAIDNPWPLGQFSTRFHMVFTDCEASRVNSICVCIQWKTLVLINTRTEKGLVLIKRSV